MSNVLPNVKTIVETTTTGTHNLWFKYENVSDDFVKKMKDEMESHIYEVHIKGTTKKPIELPSDDVDNLIDTLVSTVKMLDKNSAFVFLQANKDRADTIGYLPLLWAAARCAGVPDEAVETNLRISPGFEQSLYESLTSQFQIFAE